MNRFLFIVALLLPLLDAPAQPTDTTRRTRATDSPEANLRLSTLQALNPNSLIMTIDNRYEGLVGTPYFLPNWSNGQIVLTGGKQYTNVPIKFDAHRQALILLRPQQGNDSIIVNRATVLGFQLDNGNGQSYVFRRYAGLKSSDATVADGYFLVLHEGKITLLKRVAKTIQGADYKGGYANGNRYDAYQDANTYYLLKPDQTLTKMKLSEKSLLDALGDQKDALKAFVKQENLKFKTESDAVSLLKKYDSL